MNSVFVKLVSVWSLVLSSLGGLNGQDEPAEVLSESCMATLLNRSVTVQEGGWFAIPNVQQEPGFFRVRIYCTEGGVTREASSGYISLIDFDNDGIVLGPVTFGELTPIPVSIRVVSPASQLTSEGETAQLEATLTLPDGSALLAPGRENGTAWSSSNPRIATVSETGLVTAVSRGRVVIRALNEGVQSTTIIEVLIPEDSDGDGLPDSYELANGLNPNDPSDADGDMDGDGLTNSEEFEVGSNPRVADTDGDGLLDGDELGLGTSLTTADTDGDGLNDGEEQALGSDPLLVDSDGDGILDDLEIALGTNPNEVDDTTTIVGRLVDAEGSGVENATASVFGSLTALSSANGDFQINAVPAFSGQVVVEALRILVGEVQTGASAPVSLVSGGVTDVGELMISTNDGLISGIVVDPFGEAVRDALVEVREGDVLRESRTDVFGRYLISGITEGLVDVQVTDFSTGLRARGGATLQRNQSLVVDLELGAFGSIVGTVFQEDTVSPVGEGVDVTIRGAIGETVTTDFSGRYRFDFVPLGNYSLSAQDAEGNGGATSTSISTTSAVVEVPITYLGQGVVQGVVVDAAGEPAGGVVVELTNQLSSVFRQSLTGTTASDGGFSFGDVFVGDFTLRAVAAGSQTAATVLSEVGGNGEVVNLDVTLAEAGMLRGRFLAEDGVTPLPDATVTLMPSRIEVETDANGDYDFEFVPLGTYQIEAMADNGNFGETQALLTAQGQVEVNDIVALGFGTVQVTVLDGGGQPVRGATVLATPEEGVSRRSNTNEEGQVSFSVLSGEVGVVVTLSGSELGGSDLVTVQPNSVVDSTVMLEEAGIIQGVAISSDQEMTTVRGARVILTGAGLSRVINTDSVGGFSFRNVPLGLYNLQVFDSRGTVRFSSSVVLSQQGEVQDLDAVFSSLPSVIVNLSLEGDLSLQSIPVSLSSLSPLAGSSFQAFSGGAGQAIIGDVPAGLFTLRVNFKRDGILFFGEASGEVVGGVDTVIDLALGNSVLPSRTTLSDANGFPYGIRENGRIQDGFSNLFAGDSGENTGASVLDVTSGGTTLRFTGSDVAQTTQGGQELSIAEDGLHGLNVIRRVYVPQDGYFARQVESFTNPSSSPVTIDVTLSSHYRFNNRNIDGFITVREPRVLTTSSGDGSVEAGVDQWLVLDDDIDLDPFLVRGTLPTLTAVVEGETSGQGPDDFTFEVDRSGATGFGRVQTIWRELEIPAGETVSLLHFLSQQTEPSAAIATAERLVQLPPEALLGIEPELAPTVVNFDVPTAGSTLLPLPPRDGRLLGTVFAADGSTILPRSTVAFKSSSPLFGRTLRTTSGGDGAYEFSENRNFLLPRDSFVVRAVDPLTQQSSAEFPASFVNGEATVDVVFGGTGILLGQVRRDTGEVVERARVEVSGENLLRSVVLLTDVAGNYQLTGLPPGTYLVDATQAITGGSPIGVSSSITLSAGVTSTLDLTLEATGRLAGQAVNGGGQAQNSLSLVLRGADNFVRSIRSDTGGNYLFLDLPVGDYTLEAVEPFTRRLVQAEVSVQADLVTEFQFEFPKVGFLTIQATFDDDSFVSRGAVRVEGAGGFVRTGTTDLFGNFALPLFADSYSVELTSPQLTRQTTEASFAITSEGQEVTQELELTLDQIPLVTVTSPVSNSLTLDELELFTMTATALDDREVRYVQVRRGNFVQRDFLAPYSFSIQVPQVEADEVLSFEVVAVDSAGQSSEPVVVEVNVNKDNVPPVIESFTLSPPRNGTAYRAGERVTVTVRASDERTGIESVSFFADSELLGTDRSSLYQWVVRIPAGAGVDGLDSLSISATAQDRVGNETSFEESVPLVRDFPPTVNVLAPGEGLSFVEGTEQVFRVDASDDVRVSRVELFLDGELLVVDNFLPYETSFRVPSGEGSSPIVLTARAFDALGQSSEVSVTATRVDDTIAPELTFLSPTEGSIVSLGDTDVVIVIDTSGSTAGSAEDIFGNVSASNGENESVDLAPQIAKLVTIAPTILEAEINAAFALLDLFDPVTTRVGLVGFEDFAFVEVGLTNDFDQVREGLNNLLSNGSFGGTNFDSAMRRATDELLGLDARQGASAVQIFLSDGAASFPESEVERAKDAGIVVNTFAVSAEADIEVLQQIADETGGVATPVFNAADLVDILPNIILFGVNQLPLFVDARDDVAVREVNYQVVSADGTTLNETASSRIDPFGLLLGLPVLESSLDVSVTATARDFGENESTPQTVNVTLLPTANVPEIVRTDTAEAVRGRQFGFRGRFFEPNFSLNTVTLNGLPLEVISGSKGQLRVNIPTDAVSGPLVVSNEGGTSEPFSIEIAKVGDLELTVTFADGSVLAGAEISLGDARSTIRSTRGNLDEMGRLTVPNVSGTFSVGVSSPLIIGDVTLRGTIEEDGAVTMETISIPELTTVIIELQDSGGNPIEGADLRVLRANPGVNSFRDVERTLPATDVNGVLRIEGVILSDILVLVRDVPGFEDGSGRVLVDIDAGPEVVLPITLQDALDFLSILEDGRERNLSTVTLNAGDQAMFTVEGTERGFFGTLEDSVLQIYNSSGELVVEDDNSGEGFDAFIDWTVPTSDTYTVVVSSGSERFGFRRRGGYTLLVSVNGGAPRSTDVFVGASLSGDVFSEGGGGDEDGDFDDFVEVIYRQLNGPMMTAVFFTFNEGSYEFENIPFGLDEDDFDASLGFFEVEAFGFADSTFCFDVAVTQDDELVIDIDLFSEFFDFATASPFPVTPLSEAQLGNGVPDMQIMQEPDGRFCALVEPLVENTRGIIEQSSDMIEWRPILGYQGAREPGVLIMPDVDPEVDKAMFYRMKIEPALDPVFTER